MNETQSTYQSAPQAPPPPRTEPNPYSSYPWSQDMRRKSPILAGLLSLLPGLGQIYVGYYLQGFVNVIVVGATISLMQGRLGDLMPLAAFFLVFYWLFNVIDASRRALFYNEVMAGTDPKEFPENFRMPGSQGTLVGGVVMIVLGGVALSHTLFNIPLDWLEDWWPVALVIGGVLLLLQSTRKNGKPAGRA
jgi:TM2 domain-containing membrane protein YozV